MNRQEAAKLVAVVLASYPAQSARLDEKRQVAMVDAFETLLDDLTYAEASAALKTLIQTRNWMPSVAEIRAAVVELQRGPVRAGGEAWGDVLRAVSRFGIYRDPSFEDPIAARCVQALGWQNICNSENQPADRARFIELYDQLASQARKEATSPMLAAANEIRKSLPTPIGEALKLVSGKRGDS